MRAPIRQSDSDNGDIRAHGCAVCSVAWARNWAGDDVPTARGPLDDYLDRTRKASGATLAQFRLRGLLMEEVEKAYEAGDIEGRTPPKMRLRHGASLRDDIIPDLRDGKIAHIAVNYGALQSAGTASPSSSFRGGHAIVLAGPPENGKLPVIDPLRDRIVNIPIDDIEHAMETFGARPWGDGRGEAGIVSPSPTYESLYNDTKAKLEEVRQTLEDRTGERNACRESLVIVTTANDKQAATIAAQSTTIDGLGARIEEARVSLEAANKRIAELEANPPDCQPLVDAARSEGRMTMQAEAVLAVTGLVP